LVLASGLAFASSTFRICPNSSQRDRDNRTKVIESLRGRLLKLLVILHLGLLPFAATAEPIMVVQAMAGGADLYRMGAHLPLTIGEALGERDLIKVGLGGHVRLKLLGQDVFDIGPQTELGLEKLPSSTNADDQKTIISISRGVIRVARVAGTTNVPVHIYFGGLRASVLEGAIYIEIQQQSQRICVESGRAVVIPISDPPMTMPSPLCYATHAGQAAAFKSGDAALWSSLKSSLGPAPVAETGYPTAVVESAAPVASAPEPAVVPPTTAVPDARIAPAASPPVAASSSAPNPAPTTIQQAAPASIPERAPATASSPAMSVAGAASAPSTTPALQTSAPASSGAPAPSPIPSPAQGWTISLASVPDAIAAEREMQKLRAAGYAAVAPAVTVNGRTWYRVQLQGFSSADDARAKADEIKAKLGYANAWLIHY